MTEKEPCSEEKNIYEFMHVDELEALLSRLDPEKDLTLYTELQALIQRGGYTYPDGHQKAHADERLASPAYEPDSLPPKTSDSFHEGQMLRLFGASLGLVLAVLYIEFGRDIFSKTEISLQPNEYKFLEFPEEKFMPLRADTRVLAARAEHGEYRVWKLPVVNNNVLVSPLIWGDITSARSHECRDFGLRNNSSGITEDSYISCDDIEVRGVFEWNIDGSSRNPALPRLLPVEGEVKDGIFYKD